MRDLGEVDWGAKGFEGLGGGFEDADEVEATDAIAEGGGAMVDAV